MKIETIERYVVFYFGMGNSPSKELTFESKQAAIDYAEEQLNNPHRLHKSYMILPATFVCKRDG